jgi:predicted DNA-binding transcriptional regulator AlpA
MKITLISLSEITAKKQVPANAIRDLMKYEDFPLPVYFDEEFDQEFVGWLESDVDKWVENCSAVGSVVLGYAI